MSFLQRRLQDASPHKKCGVEDPETRKAELQKRGLNGLNALTNKGNIKSECPLMFQNVVIMTRL